jgi:hydrogenase nickel incorporation protein HypA/HybF
VHELSLLQGLMRQVEGVSRAHGGARVASVQVRLGALAHISAEHLREHFEQAAAGTAAEGARLDVDEDLDPGDPAAQDILLESVEIEEG